MDKTFSGSTVQERFLVDFIARMRANAPGVRKTQILAETLHLVCEGMSFLFRNLGDSCGLRPRPRCLCFHAITIELYEVAAFYLVFSPCGTSTILSLVNFLRRDNHVQGDLVCCIRSSNLPCGILPSFFQR